MSNYLSIKNVTINDVQLNRFDVISIQTEGKLLKCKKYKLMFDLESILNNYAYDFLGTIAIPRAEIQRLVNRKLLVPLEDTTISKEISFTKLDVKRELKRNIFESKNKFSNSAFDHK